MQRTPPFRVRLHSSAISAMRQLGIYLIDYLTTTISARAGGAFLISHPSVWQGFKAAAILFCSSSAMGCL